MLCVVYVLRRAGIKLPPETIELSPVQGWLYLGQDTRKFFPLAVARLHPSESSQQDLLRPVIHAHVHVIKRGGLLIYGQEEAEGYGKQNTPQAWYCRPAQPSISG